MQDVCRRELLRADWSSDAMHTMRCRDLFAYGRISMHKLRLWDMGQPRVDGMYYMGRSDTVGCLRRCERGVPCGSVRSFRWWVRNLSKRSDECCGFYGNSGMLHAMCPCRFEGRQCRNNLCRCRMSMRCGLCRNRYDLHSMFGRYDIFIGSWCSIMLRRNIMLNWLFRFNSGHNNCK
jgi:hypothetical protein